MKDQDNGNLDRIQVIKGWLDTKGETHEKIYNVAWGDADKPKLQSNGEIPKIGNAVESKTETFKNTIDATELKTV